MLTKNQEKVLYNLLFLLEIKNYQYFLLKKHRKPIITQIKQVIIQEDKYGISAISALIK